MNKFEQSKQSIAIKFFTQIKNIMKKVIYLFALTLLLISCSKNDFSVRHEENVLPGILR